MDRITEQQLFEELNENLIRLSEAEQLDTLMRLDERALFGSLQSQIGSMKKIVANIQKTLKRLNQEMIKDKQYNDGSEMSKTLQGCVNNFMGILNKCKELNQKLEPETNPEFFDTLKSIDKNTKLNGKSKNDAWVSSTDINDSYKATMGDAAASTSALETARDVGRAAKQGFSNFKKKFTGQKGEKPSFKQAAGVAGKMAKGMLGFKKATNGIKSDEDFMKTVNGNRK